MSHASEGPDPIDVLVGQRVRLLRRQRGVSQSGLAEAIGVSFQQVQKYEKASNRISLSMASRVAQTLGTSVGNLMGEKDDGIDAFGDVAALLSEPGALDLLRGYAALRRGTQRRAVVDFLRSFVTEC